MRSMDPEHVQALAPRHLRLIPLLGLSYFVVSSVFLIVQSIVTTGSLARYQLFFVPFIIFSSLAVEGVRRKSKLGFITAISVTALLTIIFFTTQDGNDVITVLSNPTSNFQQFVFYITNVPTFFAVLISSTLGLVRVRQYQSVAENLSKKPPNVRR